MSSRVPPSESSVPRTAGRPEGEDFLAEVTVPNRIESVRPAAQFLVQAARALRVPAASRPLFEVAVTEAVTNAVRHGHGFPQRGTIRGELDIRDDTVVIRIFDDGPGFDIPARGAPAVKPDEPETIGESGYGLPIMHSVFPVVRGVRVDGRFALELRLPKI